ncbi:MAG: type II secretion system F family protein [Lachnospiraceae bacterium]|nr:type II secretion system F family protein [Lachnospiraceae bacterium]
MIRIIFSLLGAVCSIFWFINFFKYKNDYKQYIGAIDKKQYLLPEMFFIGFGIIDGFHIDTNNKYANTQIKLFAELYSEKYSRFYFTVNLAAQITYIVTFTAIGLLIAGALDITVGILVVVTGLFLAFYVAYDIKDKVTKRRDDIMATFPHVLSKMSLLINAGMPLREVVAKLAYAEDETLYREFGIMSDEINNGIPERVAMANLANRCGTQEIRKFTTLMIQNMEKGSKELSSTLTEMNSEIWRDRKNSVRQMGEKASAKLMLPIMIIFVGIMILVLVPMLGTVSF